MSVERADVWLPLLRTLTEISPEWAVWKNVESALTGSGDIDAVAPARDLPRIKRAFLEWAAEAHLTPALACPHIPGGLNLVALDPATGFLFEVGVKQRKAFRGSALFAHEDLVPFMEMDERGFRRVQSGVEGVLKLVLNGIRPWGRPNWPDIRSKNVRELIESDAAGAAGAAALFGPVAVHVRRLSRAVVDGKWNRRSAAVVEIAAIARAGMHPGLSVQRLRFKLGGMRSCPVVEALLHNARFVPGDREEWLRAVERTHLSHTEVAS